MPKAANYCETCLPSSIKLLRVILFILLIISLIVQMLNIALVQTESGCPTYEMPHFRWALVVPLLFGLCALVGLLVVSHDVRTFCLLFFICGIVLIETHIYREVKRGSVRWISNGCGQDMSQLQLALAYFWFSEALLAALIVCLDFCLQSYACKSSGWPPMAAMNRLNQAAPAAYLAPAPELTGTDYRQILDLSHPNGSLEQQADFVSAPHSSRVLKNYQANRKQQQHRHRRLQLQPGEAAPLDSGRYSFDRLNPSQTSRLPS